MMEDKIIDGVIRDWNNQRKGNKNVWIQCSYFVGGTPVWIKSYNTWIQLMYVDLPTGRQKFSCPMDCRVKDVNEFIETSLKGIL